MLPARGQSLLDLGVLVILLTNACVSRGGFRECEHDANCLTGWLCEQGECMRPCSASAPCSSGACEAGRCVCDAAGCPQPCETDDDCSAGICLDYACSPRVTSCSSDQQNACGGCTQLGATLGDACGTCGVTVCSGVDSVACSEAATNLCGGCAALVAAPGDSCGSCDIYVCDGVDSLTCQSVVPNTCGGCSVLAGEPGARCGACGTYGCNGTDAVECNDLAANACGGCDDVLQDGNFEAPPLCQDRTVSDWTVSQSQGWLWHSGTPKTGDDDGCTVGSIWGCASRLNPLGSGSCLLMWGQGTCPVGEWVEIQQTYDAPATVTGIRIQYAVSTRHQWTFDWKYEVFYAIDGVRTLVDTVIATNVGPLAFDSGVLVPSQTGSAVTVILRVEKIGPQEGHGWLTMDDVVVDLCW